MIDMKLICHVLAFAILVFPAGVMAQGLVPCGGEDDPCGTEDIVKLVENVVEFLITILSALAVIVMVYAGFRMVTAGGNENEWQAAKGMFTNVVIGIIIVLAAWLIVDTILELLTGTGFSGWPLI